MAKSRRLTAEDMAAHAERSRQFKELLVRRQARDEELKAAREKAEPRRRK